MSEPRKINVILTGATGMVGEGVLHECLQDKRVNSVLIINRRPAGISHPKLKEVIHSDFFDLSSIRHELEGYDTCLFCMGVSAVGMKEEEYSKLTYDLTLHFAGTLKKNGNDMVFCYISGSGTDSTEKGRSMWARVKGRTENALLNMGFRDAYMFRPGYMQPTKGLKNTLKWYKAIMWLYPLLRAVFPNFVSTLAELGQAMISVSAKGYDKKIIEVRDIKKLAKG